MDKTRVGIVGYGNLGKGVKAAVKQNEDIELIAIFTRRPVESLEVEEKGVKVLNNEDAENYTEEIDVLLLCGGSATDLPKQGPHFAQMFNTVDSYDNHEEIPHYFEEIDQAAAPNGNTSAISIGWDPGLFSLNRMIFQAVIPEGKDYTFWGEGVSQGHSDAIRRVEGVKDAVQYTIPIEEAVDQVREGTDPELEAREKHVRECYIVAEEGADKNAIEKEIKNMPNYFEDYKTIINFISEAELEKNHAEMPHGGFVIRSGETGEKNKNKQIAEFSLNLESNPEFTASVLVAYARAVHRLNEEGETGAKTIFDIPPAYIINKTDSELRKNLL